MRDTTDRRETVRHAMVERQIGSRGVRDDRLLEAMRTVPRDAFVGEEVVEFAYEDSALPIEAGQTISQPYIVAVMIEALELEPEDRVLEVGAGSGYAAGVVSRMAEEVFAIERHRSLAEAARHTLDRLGYGNVTVLHGDGTLGREDEAPFDAILVSAGGAEVPKALKEQLAPGGRMVMPVGEQGRIQRLKVFEKDPSGAIMERSLGDVRFVPLISHGGEEPEEEPAETGTRTPAGSGTSDRPETAGDDGRRAPATLDRVRRQARSFDSVDELDADRIAERLAGHTTILLGEASHGTSEFYRARERITRQLVEREAISFVAVEADWPDAARLDAYVRGVEEEPVERAPFQRFPRWMWANEETLAFLRWLRAYNAGIEDPDDRIGFFGLDLYSLHTSIEAVLEYLDDVDPETAALARDRFGCLTPFQADPQTYGRLASLGRLEGCEDEVVEMLQNLLDRRIAYEADDGRRYLDAIENARLVANAERYYRAMYRSPTASWNLRDQHMFDTLVDLLHFHGDDAAAAVWAHNSHLGDASATEMGAGGKHNVGQLCRARFGVASYSLGMGTHTGRVRAAHDWGDPGVDMRVRPSLEGSYERLSHDVESGAFTLPLRPSGELRRALARERPERAIGVIYRPDMERVSHYFHAALPRQFDEWLFFDRTSAVTPLERTLDEDAPEDTPPETYPFAV